MARTLLIAGAVAAVAAGAGGVAVAAGGESQAAADDPHFVPLDEIRVPIVGTDRIEGTLQVKLVIEAADAGAAAAMTDRLPELRAASIAAAIEFSRLYASAFAAINAEQLRDDVTAALKRANPAIERVLVVEVAAQKA